MEYGYTRRRLKICSRLPHWGIWKGQWSDFACITRLQCLLSAKWLELAQSWPSVVITTISWDHLYTASSLFLCTDGLRSSRNGLHPLYELTCNLDVYPPTTGRAFLRAHFVGDNGSYLILPPRRSRPVSGCSLNELCTSPKRCVGCCFASRTLTEDGI